jgi:Leucine-rich repeat (LRR) protein
MPAGNSSSTSPLVFFGTGRYLDLSSNAISGTIPKQLSTLTLLNSLLLDDNKLTGNIPTQFTKLAALGTFTLDKNTLSKAIPTTLGAWGANVG